MRGGEKCGREETGEDGGGGFEEWVKRRRKTLQGLRNCPMGKVRF